MNAPIIGTYCSHIILSRLSFHVIMSLESVSRFKNRRSENSSLSVSSSVAGVVKKLKTVERKIRLSEITVRDPAAF